GQSEWIAKNDDEYIEKAIRLYDSLKSNNKDILYRLSAAYLNLGIIYYELNNFQKSIQELNQSLHLRINNNLTNIGLPYLNLAKTYSKLNQPGKAEEYFRKSLESFEKEYGKDYYRTAEVWFEYAKFLQLAGRNSEALEAHMKALTICRKIYGDKHPLTALAFKNIGDFYSSDGNYEKALESYQDALIAISSDFDNHDINTNPEPASALFDIRLLEILKSKAAAFEKLAEKKNAANEKISLLNNSLATLDIALNLIENIRSSYTTEENKMYLAENEKETYIQAVHTAFKLYNITGQHFYAERMYEFAGRCKASVLRSEIAGREYLFSAGLPDTLGEKQKNLARNIAAYSYLILEESRKPVPDSIKIAFWKDELFNFNRQNEVLEETINRMFPEYRNLLEKTKPLPLNDLQKRIGNNETVLDYLIADRYENGRKKIYTFTITKRKFEPGEYSVDSLFEYYSGLIRRANTPEGVVLMNHNSFTDLTKALFYMYENLFMPFEKYFTGNKLIIIPDGEISLLPFEAFIKEKPKNKSGFEDLEYLIRTYVFSYGYSSSLITGKKTGKWKNTKLYAFIPYYNEDSIAGNNAGNLKGAEKELEQAFKHFKGKQFVASQATRNNFLSSSGSGSMFHLAMHSFADTTDSRFSYLLFINSGEADSNGKLYSYEISLSRINSPLVILSACNSGIGPLNRVEGALSLARSFVLAGASSVIRTSWEINDETSSEIISSFYKHLSKGRRKDDALRLAKLDYLAGHPPLFLNPYYWAAYEIIGDSSPVMKNKNCLFLQASLIIITILLAIIYLRRRKILAAFSR
ncbi:MAG: CHAT domain-containing protein, partial [Bacteroidales bacterium]